jgi:hypothetical protein
MKKITLQTWNFEYIEQDIPTSGEQCYYIKWVRHIAKCFTGLVLGGDNFKRRNMEYFFVVFVWETKDRRVQRIKIEGRKVNQEYEKIPS